MPQDRMAEIEAWAGVTDGKWTRRAEEKFARAGEKYIREGIAPTEKLTSAFESFKKWLEAVYKSVQSGPLAVNLTPEVRAFFDGMFTPQEGFTPPETPTPRSESYPEVIHTRNESTEELAVEQGVEPYDSPSQGDKATWRQEAIEQGLVEDALNIATESFSRQRALSPQEEMALGIRLATLAAETDQLRLNGGDVTQIARNQEDIKIIQQATKLGGSIWSAAGRSRQGPKELSLTETVIHAEETKGKPLSKSEEDAITKEWKKMLAKQEEINIGLMEQSEWVVEQALKIKPTVATDLNALMLKAGQLLEGGCHL